MASLQACPDSGANGAKGTQTIVRNRGVNNRGVANGGVSNGDVNSRGVINRTCD